MAGCTLTENDDVRALLGSDVVDLPDSVVNSNPFKVYTELKIKNLLADAGVDCDDLTADQEVIYQAILATAIAARLACSYMRRRDGRDFTIGHFRQGANKADYSQICDDLVDQVGALIFELVDPAVENLPAIPFSVAGPTRAGSASPATSAAWARAVSPIIINQIEDNTED